MRTGSFSLRARDGSRPTRDECHEVAAILLPRQRGSGGTHLLAEGVRRIDTAKAAPIAVQLREDIPVCQRRQGRRAQRCIPLATEAVTGRAAGRIEPGAATGIAAYRRYGRWWQGERRCEARDTANGLGAAQRTREKRHLPPPHIVRMIATQACLELSDLTLEVCGLLGRERGCRKGFVALAATPWQEEHGK